MFNLSNSSFSDEDFELSIAYAVERLTSLGHPKAQQAEALTNFLKGRDLFISLPTGYGKSTIFHGAPLACDFLNRHLSGSTTSSAPIKPIIAVVISPILALIRDQVKYLKTIGVPAVHLHGPSESSEWNKNSELLKSGQISIVFF